MADEGGRKVKWIMADKVLTITIYDEEHEDHLQKRMTVEDILDSFTDEGCPTIYSNPADVEPVRQGKWIEKYEDDPNPFFRRRFYCTACNEWTTHGKSKFCPHCGAQMERDE